MSDPTSQDPGQNPGQTGGRRRVAEPSKRRRIDAVLVAAVVLPLLVLLAGAAIRVGAPEPRASAPEVDDRHEYAALCPSAGVPAGSVADPDAVVPDSGTVRAGTSAEVAADLSVTVGEAGEDVAPSTTDAEVSGGSLVDQSTGDLAIVRATDDAAGGLVAGRFDAEGGAGVTCRAPSTGAWFVGLGAGSERSSVVELTNPDSGNAVATLSLHDENGAVRAESIRSVVIASGEMRRLDLGRLTPTAGELALHVDVSRGRLGIEALQTTDPLDGGAGASYWAAPVTEPATSTTLLGLPGDADTQRTLLLANPGEDTAQVGVQILGPGGAFAPTGIEETVVQPGAVAAVDVTAVLSAALAEGAEGAVGIRVNGSAPVVASLRSGAGVEESVAATAAAVPELTASGDLAAVLPPGLDGAAVLVSNAGGEEATPEVVARDASGAELLRQDVTLLGGASTRLDIPAEAARVEVRGVEESQDVRGAVVAAAGRTSVLALAPALPFELVPTVRRDWP